MARTPEIVKVEIDGRGLDNGTQLRKRPRLEAAIVRWLNHMNENAKPFAGPSLPRYHTFTKHSYSTLEIPR
jgi:hypothetical protein